MESKLDEICLGKKQSLYQEECKRCVGTNPLKSCYEPIPANITATRNGLERFMAKYPNYEVFRV